MKQRISLILISLVSVLYCLAEDLFLPSWYEGRIYDAKVYDDTLFVAIDNGIYSYALKEQDAEWKPYAFSDMRIMGLVKSSGKIMVNYYPVQPQGETQRKYLLLSEDYGKTYSDITPEDAMFSLSGGADFFFRQAPQNHDHVYFLYVGQGRCMQETQDFGRNWTTSATYDIDHGFFAFDPNNDSHVLVYGPNPEATDITLAYLLETNDNFQTLTSLSYEIYYPCIPLYSMAFNPSDPQRLLATTPEGIAKSTDTGRTWTQIPAFSDLEWVYGSNILFDPKHPQRVYAIRNKYEDEVLYSWEIFRSEDSGETWKLFYAPSMFLRGRIVDVMLFDDQIIIVSEMNSIVRLQANDTSISSMKYINNDNGALLFDLQGRRLESQPEKGTYIQNGKKVVVK